MMLLADEPTEALDEVTAEGILRLLRARCEDGAACMLDTHGLTFAAWADGIVRLRDGHVETVTRRSQVTTAEVGRDGRGRAAQPVGAGPSGAPAPGFTAVPDVDVPDDVPAEMRPSSEEMLWGTYFDVPSTHVALATARLLDTLDDDVAAALEADGAVVLGLEARDTTVPISEQTRRALYTTVNTADVTVGTGPGNTQTVRWAAVGATLVIALIILALVTMLAATESDHDLRTMVAVGAAPRMRRRFLGLQAGLHAPGRRRAGGPARNRAGLRRRTRRDQRPTRDLGAASAGSM